MLCRVVTNNDNKMNYEENDFLTKKVLKIKDQVARVMTIFFLDLSTIKFSTLNNSKYMYLQY